MWAETEKLRFLPVSGVLPSIHATTTNTASNSWAPASFWKLLAYSQFAATQQMAQLASSRQASARADLLRKPTQPLQDAGLFLCPSTCIVRFRSEEHTSELQSLMRSQYA